VWPDPKLTEFETKFFKNIIVLSKSLSEKLKLSYKANIIPLGAATISNIEKRFDEMHLLYVGTLYNRHIDTITGFKSFYDAFKDQITLFYTIIGDGPNNEAQASRDLVSKYGLSDVVKITGRIPHTPILAPYFNICNIGVFYVPLTDYYDCQLVTKTFEYLLSGMPVVATNTSENRAVIQSKNGVLVGETADDFYAGLKTISRRNRL